MTNYYNLESVVNDLERKEKVVKADMESLKSWVTEQAKAPPKVIEKVDKNEALT
jgi:hypothetical protein